MSHGIKVEMLQLLKQMSTLQGKINYIRGGVIKITLNRLDTL